MDSNETAAHVQKFMRDNGVLVNVAHGKTVRLIPPLIIGQEHVDIFMDLFVKAIQ
jgi:acetylornithine aminotransferase/acetylornithine/N-succinyldiaminopimelate aminotransferase